MLFLVMGFISLADVLKCMVFRSRHFCIRPQLLPLFSKSWCHQIQDGDMQLDARSIALDLWRNPRIIYETGIVHFSKFVYEVKKNAKPVSKWHDSGKNSWRHYVNLLWSMKCPAVLPFVMQGHHICSAKTDSKTTYNQTIITSLVWIIFPSDNKAE